MVQCEAVPLATRYRWRMQIVGVQSDYVLAASSTAPLATINSADPGQTVSLLVQAVNGASQGVASDPLLFTVPLAVRQETAPNYPATAPTAPAVDKDAGARNGHGYRNGQANGKDLLARAA